MGNTVIKLHEKVSSSKLYYKAFKWPIYVKIIFWGVSRKAPRGMLLESCIQIFIEVAQLDYKFVRNQGN